MTDEEFRRRLDRVDTDIEGLKSSHNAIVSRLASMETRDAVAEVHHTSVERRLDSIEGTLTWLVRLIIGAIILAAIAYALGGGLTIDKP